MPVFETLENHDHIAFDLDECLLGGDRMATLRHFIAKYAEEKTFSIITCRPAQYEEESIKEIDACLRMVELDHTVFTHIIHSPDKDICGYDVNPHFKGDAAKKIGATILVDDDIEHQAGCDLNDIAFFHVPFTPIRYGYM